MDNNEKIRNTSNVNDNNNNNSNEINQNLNGEKSLEKPTVNDNNNNNSNEANQNLNGEKILEKLTVTNTINSVCSNSSGDSSTNLINNVELLKELVFYLKNKIDELSKPESIYNINGNVTFINNQTNEIKMNNEVNITENKQINNNTEINNNITTINNNDTNYDILNNRLFKCIYCILDKGCNNKNLTIRIVSKISKFFYNVFCESINISVNTSKKFEDYVKITKALKNMLLFFVCWIVICIIFYEIYKFYRISENLSNSIPNNLSTLKNKMQSVFSINIMENVNYLLKNSIDAVCMLKNQTEHFIVDNSKNAINYTYKIAKSTTLAIQDTSYQICSAVNSKVVDYFSLIPKSYNEIQSTVKSTISSILNNGKINGVAYSIKDTITNTTPMIVSSGNEVYQSVYNFIDKNILKDPHINSFLSKKIMNIFSKTKTIEDTKVVEEVNKKVMDKATTIASNNENTINKFVKQMISKIYQGN